MKANSVDGRRRMAVGDVARSTWMKHGRPCFLAQVLHARHSTSKAELFVLTWAIGMHNSSDRGILISLLIFQCLFRCSARVRLG